ncbi:restriction endonuclease subunit S [Vibrio sp. Vb2531]|uniref:restriction endonuclease subunit S n=1 Tax=Vibrio sp. Vb2531 TaxID=3074665 RepID=UPI0029654765|nr:restriction endonuclease subunit S [Vibrio sp. Vb2531]MDW1743423.1 restriction endonuclease subunit S [Vibrio sp. Vb2531]
MSCNWPNVALGKYCSKIGSGATPKGGNSVYLDSGEITLIRSQNIYNEGFKSDGLVYITPEAAQKLKNVIIEPNDVLINITGDSVARVCLAPKEHLPARVNQHVAIIRVDPKEFDHRYLRYYLTSLKMQSYLLTIASSGATRNALTKSMLESLEVSKPPLDIQKKIGDVLEQFENKIQLNTQTNQTLEEMAQAIFKSWFVDFDPVKAKMNGEQPEGMDAVTASLFPDKLVDTEVGELPEGWSLVAVGELLDKTIGGDWGKEEPDEKHTEEVRIVRGTDIPKLHGGAIESVPVRYVESKKLKTRKLERGDIVIEVSGGSKDQPTGRSLFISDNILKRLELPSEPASFCRRFNPKSYEIGLLLAVHFQLMYQAGKTWEYQNQSTGISNFQTKYFLEAEHIVIPSDDVLDAFVKQVSPMMDMIHSNQNIELAKLRDTLLPKLLSGEIELGETEEMAEVN